MGTLKTYRCNKCNYSTEISGGADVGFIVKTNTMLCEQCMEVVDVVTEYWEFVKPTNCEVSDIGRCLECNSKEYLKEWDSEKRPCPKCDGKLEIDEHGVTTMWD